MDEFLGYVVAAVLLVAVVLVIDNTFRPKGDDHG